jgi:hypothetical protein
MNNNQNPQQIKETFLKYLNKATKENKRKEFCTEIQKLCSDKNLSHLSVDTICYIASLKVSVKDLNF